MFSRLFKKQPKSPSPEYETSWRSIDWSVFQGRNTTRAQAHAVETDRSFTVTCKTYKLKNKAGSAYPFTFTDIAGMHKAEDNVMTDDIIKLLNGHIKSGYIFNPNSPITEEDPKYNKKPILKDKIHCLVAVIAADTVSMQSHDVFKQLRDVREKARDLCIPQVIIMTKVDEICPLVKEDLTTIYRSKKIKQKMEECSVNLGVPLNCIFPVKNYHQERTTDTTIDILILDALQNIIYFANDHVEDEVDSE
ncbi:interferon-induced protein 44-like isoform X2 [Garra rufa]|uniref:interferon-induced protein 44-like isoform X2 n=1 Tax=Garra rufa TaxID=137080 RepID=UPI003CCEE458